MNLVLNFGWVTVFLAAGIRWVMAQSAGFEVLDFHYLEKWELWVYGGAIALTAFSIWHIAFRDRCPRCRAVSPVYRGAQEIDRWVGTKTVMEEIGAGKTVRKVKRTVSTTFVKLEHHYSCRDCNHNWTRLEQREKE